MAYAPANVKALGEFVEKSFGRTFQYALSDEMFLSPPAYGGKNKVFPHKIYVGPTGDDYRIALVLGSVAHVIVDERDNGGWIIEKWEIKKHRKYSQVT